VLSKPFVKKTATDEFRLLGNISKLLACMGEVFAGDYPMELQMAICQVCSSLPCTLT
jgi:hypothetical protein